MSTRVPGSRSIAKRCEDAGQRPAGLSDREGRAIRNKRIASKPAASTNTEAPTDISWGFFLPVCASSRVLLGVPAEACGIRQPPELAVPGHIPLSPGHSSLRPEPLAAPALQSGLADAPARGQLLLIEVNDVHLGLLPNGLAGVHEGSVRPNSQGVALSGT